VGQSWWGRNLRDKAVQAYVYNAYLPNRVYIHDHNVYQIPNYPGDIHVFIDSSGFIIFMGQVAWSAMSGKTSPTPLPGQIY